MNGFLKTQLNDKKTIEPKINEMINISRSNIDTKMKLITNLLLSLKEENEQIIVKSKKNIY